MANELKAEAIVVFTLGGHMARHAAWMRPRYSPIYAICDRAEVAQVLTLSWGVVPRIIPFDPTQPDNTLAAALALLRKEGVLQKGNTAVVIGAIASNDKVIDAVQMRQIE